MATPHRIGINIRPNTGPMQFGIDWPGFFFRGDDAISTATTLRMLADHLDDPALRESGVIYLNRLADQLCECAVEDKAA